MDQWYSAATTIQNKFSNVKADQFKMPRRLKYTLLSLVWGGNISIGTIVPMIVFENHTQLNWSYAAFYSFNGAITAAYFFVVLYTTGRSRSALQGTGLLSPRIWLPCSEK